MVDALASGASTGNGVEVRVLSWAPKSWIVYFDHIRLLQPQGAVESVRSVSRPFIFIDEIFCFTLPDKLNPQFGNFGSSP